MSIKENKEMKISVLALKNTVIVPKSIVPVVVGRKNSIKAIENSLLNSDKKEIFIAVQKNQNDEIFTQENIEEIGTICTILQVSKMSKGNIKVLLEGKKKGKVSEIEEIDDCIYANFEETKIKTLNSENSRMMTVMTVKIGNLYKKYVKYNSKAQSDLSLVSYDLDDIDLYIDMISTQLPMAFDEKKKLFMFSLIDERLNYIIKFLKDEIEIYEAEERIQKSFVNSIETSQKEYYLKEQIKAIQKELKVENIEENLDKYKKKAKEIGMSKEAFERLEKELSRIEQMQEFSAEASVSRTYIDWLLSLPWQKKNEDTVALTEAKDILNKNHFGLGKIKEYIMEIISAKKYAKDDIRSPIICLVGPPGVGKTSLARSIAESLNKEFIRIALGGSRDEADIKGHRRTYVGAMPGKIIQGMKRANTINPVMLLDEIDKMSSDANGDPGAALLEVLDYEQNKQFFDSYIDIPYDISRVTFIATANSTETIPYPLLDRMEIINVSGYTKEEKYNIAKKFLIPKSLDEHKLKSDLIEITDDAINNLIIEYTRESGVRQLERLIIRIVRKTISKILEQKDLDSNIKKKKQKKIIIDKEAVHDYFKSPIFKIKTISNIEKVGIAVGLAWTEQGGDVLEVEVSTTPGKGNIMLTGQLGEVMQESAHAAFTYLKSKFDNLGLSKSKIMSCDVHIHVPEGATPKDGPSAGITICTALFSRFCNIPIRPDVAMTGEITLQGRVLGIGGLKEKLLAAIMYGYKLAIVPYDDKEIAEEIIKELGEVPLKIIYAENMDQVLSNALTKSILTVAVKKRRKQTVKRKPNAKAEKEI